jgi:hypothetical protein
MASKSCGAFLEGNVIVCPTCFIPTKQISGPLGVPEKDHDEIIRECQECGMELSIRYYPCLKITQRLGYEA